MKRIVAWIAVLAFLLCGCDTDLSPSSETVTFYFLQKEFNYEQYESVIVAEKRDSTGMRRDLSYMLALYLMGPVEEEHTTPLPSGTRIYHSTDEEGNIQLELSAAARSMSDAELSIAAACLAMTCFDITDAESVTVENGERSITMNSQNLTLVDHSANADVTEETT